MPCRAHSEQRTPIGLLTVHRPDRRLLGSLTFRASRGRWRRTRLRPTHRALSSAGAPCDSAGRFARRDSTSQPRAAPPQSSIGVVDCRARRAMRAGASPPCHPPSQQLKSTLHFEWDPAPGESKSPWRAPRGTRNRLRRWPQSCRTHRAGMTYAAARLHSALH
eukprot:scaffold2304_cov134-Isochrysis_galbana.AAC.4